MFIQDKASKSYYDIVSGAVSMLIGYLPQEDFNGIERVVILDRNQEPQYEKSGAMYYLKENNNPAFIEIYPEIIFNAMPMFIPKTNFFKKYSIVRMMLHEIGHHVYRKYAYARDSVNWEKSAYEYMSRHIWGIYKFWMIFFKTIGQINIWIKKAVFYPKCKS